MTGDILLYLCSQQTLVKGKQRFVDFEDIILLLLNEILNDDIKDTAMTKRKACSCRMSP